MKKTLALLMAVIVPLVIFSAESPKGKKKKADKNTQEWYYEIEACSAPYRGACNVKVWSYGPDVITARDQATKNAVHGVMFRGVPANPSMRINALPALVSDFAKEKEYEQFFTSFFADGGPYLRYAVKTVSAGGDEIMKYAKKNYKVGVIVTVQYDELRRMLQRQGIVESLTSGFSK